MPDRRRFARIPLQLSVRCVRGQGLGVGQELASADVSRVGIGLIVREAQPPAIGSLLRLELAIPPGIGYSAGPLTLRCRGRVVRTQLDEDGTWRIGIAFTHPLHLELWRECSPSESLTQTRLAG